LKLMKPIETFNKERFANETETESSNLGLDLVLKIVKCIMCIR